MITLVVFERAEQIGCSRRNLSGVNDDFVQCSMESAGYSGRYSEHVAAG